MILRGLFAEIRKQRGWGSFWLPHPRFCGFGAGFPVRAGAGSGPSAWVLNGILELLCAGEG